MARGRDGRSVFYLSFYHAEGVWILVLGEKTCWLVQQARNGSCFDLYLVVAFLCILEVASIPGSKIFIYIQILHSRPFKHQQNRSVILNGEVLWPHRLAVKWEVKSAKLEWKYWTIFWACGR